MRGPFAFLIIRKQSFRCVFMRVSVMRFDSFQLHDQWCSAWQLSSVDFRLRSFRETLVPTGYGLATIARKPRFPAVSCRFLPFVSLGWASGALPPVRGVQRAKLPSMGSYRNASVPLARRRETIVPVHSKIWSGVPDGTTRRRLSTKWTRCLDAAMLAQLGFPFSELDLSAARALRREQERRQPLD